MECWIDNTVLNEDLSFDLRERDFCVVTEQHSEFRICFIIGLTWAPTIVHS